MPAHAHLSVCLSVCVSLGMGRAGLWRAAFCVFSNFRNEPKVSLLYIYTHITFFFF